MQDRRLKAGQHYASNRTETPCQKRVASILRRLQPAPKYGRLDRAAEAHSGMVTAPKP